MRRSRLIALITTLTVLAVAGCSWLLGQVDPEPGPTPPTTAASTPVASTSPTESEFDRERRLDQEAAVAAYQRMIDVTNGLYTQGGANETPGALRAVATGDYLELIAGDLRAAKKNGWRASQGADIVYVAARGWSKGKIGVKACEDVTRARLLDERGRDVTPKGDRRYIQDYTVVRGKDDVWRVSEVTSKPVRSFDNEGCGE